ncbi:unnamed protein product [Adineta ricciae]|uniref:Major facilitator superfamily (MFS) profile domain-containing protein n=1 Tax=Adineta ricciae TaxID=249248 RepID=A0A813RTN3_ADIRI|nr:unnamed protein product [Adineta ricciae]CAF1184716.1 unnamed protein product [Adineta ricciae]
MLPDLSTNSASGSDMIRSWLPWKVKQLGTFTLLKEKYPGDGTKDSPFTINWLDNDPENPKKWPTLYKFFLILITCNIGFSIGFVTSAYIGPFNEIKNQFDTDGELVILGLSLFSLSFAITPLFWAPFSEMFGRRPLFILTFGILTVFNAATAGSQNIWTLIILRVFAGAFGASSMVNAAGVIADLFDAAERGIPLSIFVAATFLGIVIGPIVGAFMGETVGWRWVEGVMGILDGILWIIMCLFLPETYNPLLLHKRAVKLSDASKKVYRTKFEAQHLPKFREILKTSLFRPWIILFREPIVLLLSIYMAIIFGILNMFVAAFPIVYEEKRDWSEGISQLPFLGILLGVVLCTIYSLLDNVRYNNSAKNSHDGHAPPELRLPPAIVGSICLPAGLFWFAWSNSPSVHWIVSVLATVPFGFGINAIFVGIFNYLIDAYTIYAASTLGANMIIRYTFGAAFVLFTTQMYDKLGIHWATSIIAFLTLICAPFPFLFYKYGARIRKRCRFAAEVEQLTQQTFPTKVNVQEEILEIYV